MIYVVALVVAVLGVAVGYAIRKAQVSNKVGSAEAVVQRMLDAAKAKEKEIILDAKSKAIEMTEAVSRQENELRQQMLRSEQRLEKKEGDLDARARQADAKLADLDKKNEEARKFQDEMRELKAKQLQNIEKIAGLTRDEAKKVLLDNTEGLIKEETMALYRKIVNNAREEADKKAREIVAHAIERCAADVTTETTTTIVHIPNEEMKGRIIGKEGRNIRSFEQLMGVEILNRRRA